MLTVADIRRAIQGLPDDAGVCLVVQADGDPEDGPFVMLAGFARDEGRALVIVDVMGMGDDDEDDFGGMVEDEVAGDIDG